MITATWLLSLTHAEYVQTRQSDSEQEQMRACVGLCGQTHLEVFLSVGGGRCEESVRARGPALEEEARQGRPLNGSESGGAAPGFLTRLPPQTGRETTCDPEPERALREPAAGTAPPGWGWWAALIWTDRDLSFRVLEEEKTRSQTDSSDDRESRPLSGMFCYENVFCKQKEGII